MSDLTSRLVQYYVRRSYPLRVVDIGDQYLGSIPDLPACEVRGEKLGDVYAQLEVLRQRWIQEHAVSGSPIPMPGSHLGKHPLPPKSIHQMSEDEKNKGR